MPISRRHLISLAASALAAQTAPPSARRVLSARPEDFEMPLSGFQNEITPLDLFFVRSHHYTPDVNLSEFSLEVGGLVEKPLKFSLDQLKRMPRQELVAVLECAGNGRGLFEPSMPGLQWTSGGVGNARFAGVRLRDLLRQAGLRREAVHILMDGVDVPVATQPKFQRTIPVAKALDADTILAYEMNGQPLRSSHGLPLRLVAPGWAGDSWTKWLTRLTALDKEFDGFYMKTGYRHPGRAVKPGSAVDPSQMRPVTSLSVKSAIAAPTDGATIPRSQFTVRGAAWSGESPLARVEVSLDAGRTWKPARLSPALGRYSWRLWDLPATGAQPGWYSVMARAWDAAGNTQPLEQEWNPSGYEWNVVSSAGVQVVEDGTAIAPAAAAPAAPEDPSSLPAAYRRACLTCHGNELMTQQRLTRGQWEREVDKMIKWGAPVPADARSGILDFLASKYGPRR